MNAAKESVPLVYDLDGNAATLEGYLFPEPTRLRYGTRQSRPSKPWWRGFHEVIAKLRQTIPPNQWPPNLRQTIILASIVESEAAKDEERELIASVYQNRLDKKMLLPVRHPR